MNEAGSFSGLAIAHALAGDCAVEEGLARSEFGVLDEFVRLVGLLDAARAANHRRPAGALKLAAFRGEWNCRGLVADFRDRLSERLGLTAIGFERRHVCQNCRFDGDAPALSELRERLENAIRRLPRQRADIPG